jgi:hypothetical protein
MNKYLLLEYPYYNLYYKLNKREILKLIIEYKPKIYDEIPEILYKYKLEKYENKFFIIEENYLNTYIINNLTDYFSEKVRIKCKFAKNISMYEYWNNKKNEIIQKTLNKYNKVNIYNLRETIYYNIKGCNNFRITVALTILKYFNVKKWLDISAGWGDRLLSAIFNKVKLYVSADPNLDLHPCYDDIINKFVSPSKRKNFIIYKNGFLEAPIEEMNFDVVFSSPPFFTLEKYSIFKENSVTKHKTEKEWCDNFFAKSLIKSYNHLKKNGHMILYMSGSDYVMKKMFLLNNIMEYKGIIYFYEKDPRAIYVWKKIKDDIITKL